MSDEDGRGVLIPSDQDHGEDGDDGNDRTDVNNPDDIPLINSPLSSWLQPHASSLSFSGPSDRGAHGAPAAGDCSLLPGADIPVVIRAVETDAFEEGSSGGSKRKRGYGAAEVMQIGAKKNEEEIEEEEDMEMSDDQCKIQTKRTQSSEIHNLKERLRRQKLKEKMKALQDLIPNCNKRDKASTLDDAIKYIKSLKYQLQIMSMGAGCAMQNSPIPAFVHLMGLGIPGPSPSSTSQSGRSSPCLLPSTTTSEPPQLDPPMLPFASSTASECASRCINPATSHIGPSRDVLTSEQCAMRSPRARVLPSQVILPQATDEAEDHGSRLLPS